MAGTVLIKDRATAFKWQGEIEDYAAEWSAHISMPRVSASGGTGGWFLAGERVSAWDWHMHAALTGIHSGIIETWTAYKSASGGGLTAFGTASALVSLKTMIRVSNDAPPSANYPFSARLITDSATAYSGQRFVQTFYLRVEGD